MEQYFKFVVLSYRLHLNSHILHKHQFISKLQIKTVFIEDNIVLDYPCIPE